MSIAAFIPLRGGSKSIPYKNIKEFCGQPLAYWVIKAASECEEIEQVFVSTDNETIKQVVEGFSFSKVQAIGRSEYTATDEATTESAMIEFAKKIDYKHMILIQATSPLLEAKDLKNAIQKYLTTKADSMVSVVCQKRFLWKQDQFWARSLNYDPTERPRRQEWEGYFVENGAFYIISRANLLKTGCRVSGNVQLYEMHEDTYFEIDEPSDWKTVVFLKNKRLALKKSEEIQFKQLNLLICDVDGVQTDGGMYYTENGDELKKFNTKDGKGLALLQEAGIQIMFLTGEDTELVKRRAVKLKVDYVFTGIKDKKSFLDHFFVQNKQYQFSRTAYIGDDLNDLECISACRFSAVPQDGLDQLKEIAHHVTLKNGGAGCVREVCDYILQQRREFDGSNH